MNISLRKSLLRATALAVLASFALPALRADEPAAPTFGALTDPASPGVAATKDGSDVAQPAAKKKGGKKKNGKKKHGKKAKDAATSADQAITTAAPATPADAAK